MHNKQDGPEGRMLKRWLKIVVDILQRVNPCKRMTYRQYKGNIENLHAMMDAAYEHGAYEKVNKLIKFVLAGIYGSRLSQVFETVKVDS